MRWKKKKTIFHPKSECAFYCRFALSFNLPHQWALNVMTTFLLLFKNCFSASASFTSVSVMLFVYLFFNLFVLLLLLPVLFGLVAVVIFWCSSHSSPFDMDPTRRTVDLFTPLKRPVSNPIIILDFVSASSAATDERRLHLAVEMKVLLFLPRPATSSHSSLCSVASYCRVVL